MKRVMRLGAWAAVVVACGDAVPRPKGPPAAVESAAARVDEHEAAARESARHAEAGLEAARRQEWSEAERELTRALELDPTNHAAAYALGQVHEAQGRWAAAAGAYDRAVRFGADRPVYHLGLGRARFESGQLDEARGPLERALELEPRLFEAHHLLGRVHDRQGRPAEAIARYQRATELNPKFGPAFVFLGRLLLDADRYADVLAALGPAAGAVEDLPARAEILRLAGHAHFGAGAYADAVASYRAAEAAGDASSALVLDLALALRASGDAAGARALLEKLVAADAFEAPVAKAFLSKARARRKPKKAPAGVEDVRDTAAVRRDRVALRGERLRVRGFVVFTYDCVAHLGAEVARDEPDRCTRRHFYLADHPDAPPFTWIWVTDVPRPPREDERRYLPKEELEDWPKVPDIAVRDEVIVEGGWSDHSAVGFVNSDGLLVYVDLLGD